MYTKDELTAREIKIAEYYRDCGLAHAKSSNQTIKIFKNMEKDLTKVQINMGKIETKVENIEKKLATHCNDQKDEFDKMHNAQKESLDKIEVMFEDAMSGKANKWVENTLVKAIWGLASLAGVGLVYLVFKATLHLY